MSHETLKSYRGFEQGPIRPPNEANSLLVRITRNCPWNRCTFCPVYKGKRFSIRPVEHVKKDIDTLHGHVIRLRKFRDEAMLLSQDDLREIIQDISPEDLSAFQTAYHWIVRGGMKSIFLQDANSLVIRPHQLIDILQHLKKRFPEVERITSYARSHTIARMNEEDLSAIGKAGLNRIHIGLESGSDKILEMVKKGSTKADHILAGGKVKDAGIELSEYIMPGLGGKNFSKEHALQTADALNQIDPDFIRLRTLGIRTNIPLYAAFQEGLFQKCTDVEVVREILTLVEHLEGITCYVASDHILNLLADFEGKLPEDKDDMINVLISFLEMKPEDQRLFRVGRRMGLFSSLSDMEDPRRLVRVEKTCLDMGITDENVGAMTEELVRRFI